MMVWHWAIMYRTRTLKVRQLNGVKWNTVQPSWIFFIPVLSLLCSVTISVCWVCISVFVSSCRWWTIPMKKQGYNGTEYLGTRVPRRHPPGWFVHCIYLYHDKTHRVKPYLGVQVQKCRHLSLPSGVDKWADRDGCTETGRPNLYCQICQLDLTLLFCYSSFKGVESPHVHVKHSLWHV